MLSESDESGILRLAPDGDGISFVDLAVPGTTGHVWTVESVDGVEIEEIEDRGCPARGVEAPIGGSFTVRFRSKGTGSATFVLRRPWEDDEEPVRTLRIEFGP